MKHRLWIYAHHDEVLLAADTSKLLLAAYPDTTRLVVGGLAELEKEMMDAVTSNPHSFVLFPAIGASTFSTLAESTAKTSSSGPCNTTHNKADITWDIVVLDGTWKQARKLNTKVDTKVARVVLEDALKSTPAHTVRAHPNPVRRISTLEAVALLLKDMGHPKESFAPLLNYLRIADGAYYDQMQHEDSGPRQTSPEGAWQM